MDAAAPLLNTLSFTRQAWMAALSTPGFYVEALCVSIAIAVAWLMAFLINRRVTEYFRKHPPKRFDSEFIIRPLPLVAPLLVIFYLGAIEPLIDGYGSGVTDAAMKLTVGYLVARGVIILVHSRPVAYFIAVVVMLVAVLRATGFMHSVLDYLHSVVFEIGNVKISMLNIVHGVVILVVVFWLAGALSRTLEQHLRRSSTLNYSTRELVVKFFRIFVYFVAILITLSAMGVDLTAFAVFGGALGVGIGLGLQKLTANFVSGITLLMEKSVKIGDLIEVSNVTGWVRQLNIRYALIETADGREVMIPNEEIISSRVTNWTYSNDLARIEIKITLDNNTDVRLAQKLMVEAARGYKNCLKDPEPAAYLREFSDAGLVMALQFWIPDVKEGRNGPQSDVMIAVLEKLRAGGVKFPGPATMLLKEVPQT